VCHNFRSISNNPLPNYNLLPFFTKRQIWRKSRNLHWNPAPHQADDKLRRNDNRRSAIFKRGLAL